jgi:hypothetical protein
MALTLEDIPFALKANDIVKHVINIDSRFRLPVPQCDDNEFTFYFNLLAPIRNVLRVRVTSIELANNYYIFSTWRRNTTIGIKLGSAGAVNIITIPDGNYMVNDMLLALNTIITAILPTAGIVLSFSAVTGYFTFTGNQPFTVYTTTPDGLSWPQRVYDYGLGYNLGFSRGTYPSVATPSGSSTKYVVISDQKAYFAGDPYVFLKVNDLACVRQTIGDTDFTALAKVIVAQSKNYMNYDNMAGQNAKEVTFPCPVDLSRFKVQLLDPHGMPISMGSSQVSFSLEILEVKNMSLYNTIRDAFTTEWVLKQGQGGKGRGGRGWNGGFGEGGGDGHGGGSY